jgi:hypothetical protein
MLTQTIFIRSSRHWNYSVLTFCKLHIWSQKMTKYNSKKVWMLKLKIKLFSNIQEITLSKIIEQKTKFKLIIPKMYLYVKFELNGYKHWDNEQKLKISEFFSKFKRDNSVSYHQTMPNSNLTIVFFWNIHILNLSWIYRNSWGDNERNQKISFFFQS